LSAYANTKPNKKCCLLDFDPQGHSCLSVGINTDKLNKTIFEAIIGECTIEETIISTEFNFDIIPSNDNLSEFDLVVIENKDNIENTSLVLKDILSSIVDNYDVIFIDCPPSRGLLTINALSASTDVIIPMQTEYFATNGVSKALKTITKVQNASNTNLNILGILPTMCDPRTSLSSIVVQEARKSFANTNIKVFENVIPKCVRYADSPMMGTPAVILYPNERLIQPYYKLIEEVF
jgi:chromosome partitioning protein